MMKIIKMKQNYDRNLKTLDKKIFSGHKES